MSTLPKNGEDNDSAMLSVLPMCQEAAEEKCSKRDFNSMDNSQEVKPCPLIHLHPTIELSPSRLVCQDVNKHSAEVTFVHLTTTTEELKPHFPSSIIEKDETGVVPIFTKSKESSPPLKIPAISEQPKCEQKQNIREDIIVPPTILEPIADFILSLHCFSSSTVDARYYEELKKTVQNLKIAFKCADGRGRNILVSQLTSKETKVVFRLLKAIQQSEEPSLIESTSELLYTCLSPLVNASSRAQLILSLIQCNAGEILLRSLKSLPITTFTKTDVGFVHGFHVIAKLASKDSKFAVKCRLIGGVKFIHQLIQSNMKNNSLLQSLLMVLKIIAKNSTNQIALGKDGCVSTLILLLSSVPKTHWTKIKLILESLALLTKSKGNVIRIMRENGLAKIFGILNSWEKIERRHQLKVLKGLLSTVSHVSDSKNGRKSIVNNNGMEHLHGFILSCPADQTYESLIGTALNIFLKCTSKGEMPVASSKGAITFQIPASNILQHSNTDMLTGENDDSDDADNTSEDESDDSMEDESDNSFKGVASDPCYSASAAYNPQTTNTDQLLKYNIFFPEMQDKHICCNATTFNSSDNMLNDDTSPRDSSLYLNLSSNVKSLINFVKVAYPDMIGAQGPSYLEPLYRKSPKVQRDKALRTLDRTLNGNNYQEKVVFDLDYLLKSDTRKPNSNSSLSNWDEKRIDKKEFTGNHLNFESRFESGNLRRAIQISAKEYDLILNSDVNSWHHHQWFYFEMSNMHSGIPYIFNIINNEKPNSEFNYGMKPVMFSVKESTQGRNWWYRIGEDIWYHKNHYVRTSNRNKKSSTGGRNYYTATFTITFPHAHDVVYLAYHYPYTFTKLQYLLKSFEEGPVDPDIYFLKQTLCQTLNGNSVPVVTVTDNSTSSQKKDLIFLTSRVHPGESNSSWVMEGLLRFLMGESNEAKVLRQAFIFKVVPFLNPEGVIHGNHRCGLTDEDLNRRWRSPNLRLHPTIFHTKALIEYSTSVIGKRPLIFCDFHGHSRQKNIFMYGCSRTQSWWPTDKDVPDPNDLWLLPSLSERHMSTFSLRHCRFQVERAKESTARVAVWRQFNVTHSFTMEASTCGCDQGLYKNNHLSPNLLLESGEGFCKALYKMVDRNACASIIQDLQKDHRLKTTTCSSTYMDDEDSEDELDLDIYGICSAL